MPFTISSSDIEKFRIQPRPIVRVTENKPSDEMRKWLFENHKKESENKIVF